MSARLETITRTHGLKDERVHNINKIKGLYEPTLESIEGFVLICSKSNILQDVCVGGGGGVGEGVLQSVKGSCVLMVAELTDKLLSKF